MKKLSDTHCALTVIFLLPFLLSAQSQATGWQKENLKGKVKSYKRTEYNTEDYLLFFEKTNLLRLTSKSFDDTGNLTENYETNGDCDEKKAYKYNNSGLLAREDKWACNRYRGYTIYAYDNNGKEKELLIYSADSSLKKKYVTVVDTIKSLLIQTAYDEKLNIIQKTIYCFDSLMRKTEKKIFEDGDRLDESTVYSYDPTGNLSGESEYDGEGRLTFASKNWYDTKGSHFEDIYYNDDGTVDDKITNLYDSRDNLIRYTRQANPRNIFYQYRYDKKGNIISITENNFGRVSAVTEIEIEYYPE